MPQPVRDYVGSESAELADVFDGVVAAQAATISEGFDSVLKHAESSIAASFPVVSEAVSTVWSSQLAGVFDGVVAAQAATISNELKPVLAHAQGLNIGEPVREGSLEPATEAHSLPERVRFAWTQLPRNAQSALVAYVIVAAIIHMTNIVSTHNRVFDLHQLVMDQFTAISAAVAIVVFVNFFRQQD